MEEKDYLRIAKKYSEKEWNFDIVLPAGEEDGWHYFSCTRKGRPRYSNIPEVVRVNTRGKAEDFGDINFRMKVYYRAMDRADSSKA